MEDLRNLKKNFVKHYETTLSSAGRDLVKEMEQKYSVDNSICLDYAMSLCHKIVKMDGVSEEDEKKCQDFIKFFYYLDEIKSLN